MNLIQQILATFRKHATDSSNEILKNFMHNTFEDKDIRYHAGRCNVHDSILSLCNQIEAQLKDGRVPDFTEATNPSAAVRSTSVPLDEVNG